MTVIKLAVLAVWAGHVPFGAFAAEWPVLRTCEGEDLRRVKMPLGGIGTGTISLSGRGSLVDWGLKSRPDKGYVSHHGSFAPHFAVRCCRPGAAPDVRLLEGPLLPEEYEGAEGCAVPNHGLPRFRSAAFDAAYPFATVRLSGKTLPPEVRLEAMNPLVPGDAEASGIQRR